MTRVLNRALIAAAFATLSANLAACASGSATKGSDVASPSSGPVTRTQTTNIGDMGRLTVTRTTDADVITVPFDAEAVFRILPSVLDTLGLPVNTIDPARKLIGNNGLKIRNRMGKTPLSMILDCGSSQIGPNADSYDVYMSVLTTVTSGGTGSAKLATLIEAQARPATYNQAYNTCTTKGYFEQKLSEAVARRLGK